MKAHCARLILLALVTTTAHPLRAIINQARIYTNSQKDQIYIQFDDIHIDIKGHATSTKQSNDLIAALTALNDITYSLIEDSRSMHDLHLLSYPPDVHKKLSTLYEDICQTSYPENLCNNTELRFAPPPTLPFSSSFLDSSLWQPAYWDPLMHLVHSQLIRHKIPTYNIDIRLANDFIEKISLHDFLNAYESLEQKIKAWDDPPLLKEYYRQAIADTHSNPVKQALYACLKLPLFPGQLTGIATCLQSKKILSVDLFRFNSEFVDMVLIHELYRSHAPIVVSIAGWEHHQNIEPILPALGFNTLPIIFGNKPYYYKPNISIWRTPVPVIQQVIFEPVDINAVFATAQKLYSSQRSLTTAITTGDLATVKQLLPTAPVTQQLIDKARQKAKEEEDKVEQLRLIIELLSHP